MNKTHPPLCYHCYRRPKLPGGPWCPRCNTLASRRSRAKTKHDPIFPLLDKAWHALKGDRPGKGLCPHCRTSPRLVRSNGAPQSYCRACTNARRRQAVAVRRRQAAP